MTGLSPKLAFFKAALLGEDADCMTIDQAYLHAQEKRAFPAKVFLDPADKARGHGRVVLRDIDFGPDTTVVLSAHEVALDTVKAGKFEQTAPMRLFDARHVHNTLSVRNCTFDAVETRGVEDIRAVNNHGAMDLTAKGVKDLYLEDNAGQTGLHVDLADGLEVVIIAGQNRLKDNAQLDFIPVTLNARRETMITDGKRFCFHKMNADKPGMRHLLEGRIDLRADLIKKAYDENRTNAADLDALETPHIMEYRAFIATLDAYAGKTQTVERMAAPRAPKMQSR